MAVFLDLLMTYMFECLLKSFPHLVGSFFSFGIFVYEFAPDFAFIVTVKVKVLTPLFLITGC